MKTKPCMDKGQTEGRLCILFYRPNKSLANNMTWFLYLLSPCTNIYGVGAEREKSRSSPFQSNKHSQYSYRPAHMKNETH